MKNGTVSVFGEAIERTAKERAHIINLLQDSQKEYLSYVENVIKQGPLQQLSLAAGTLLSISIRRGGYRALNNQ